MIDQDQTYLLQSYNQNQSLFANIDSSFHHKKSHKSLSNRQNSKKTLNLASFLQSNSNTMTNIMDISNEIKNKKFQQDNWYKNADINIKMLDSIWQDKIAEDQRTASKSIFNYMTKKNERSSKERGFVEDNTVNIKDRKRTQTSQNTVQNSGRANICTYVENRNRASSQNEQIKLKQKNIENGQNILRMMEQKTKNVRKQYKNRIQNEKQNNREIISKDKFNQNWAKNKGGKDQSFRQIERQLKRMLDRQNDETQDESMRKKIRKLQSLIQQIYRKYQQQQITIEQYQRLVYKQKQLILEQKQQYQLQLQEYESKTKRLQNIISSMHSQHLQEMNSNKNNIKNITNLLQVKQFQIYNFIHKRVTCFKKELSECYANQYRDGQENGNKIYTCNSKANLIAQYGMSNLPSNNTKSVPFLHYDPPKEQQTQTREQKKSKQINRQEEEAQLNQLPSISLSAIPKLSTILQNSNQIYKDSINEHKQANENFRRLTTFRIKQLQKQNSYLQNELNTNQMKVMIIQNQNKQLREIVQGMIQQMKKLGIYPNAYQAYDANCTFAMPSHHNSNSFKYNAQHF